MIEHYIQLKANRQGKGRNLALKLSQIGPTHRENLTPI